MGFADKIVDYVKNHISQRKLDSLNVLAFHERLHKNIDEYTHQDPHVIAAKKLIQNGIPISKGDIISYVMTYEGAKPLMYAEYQDIDVEYYITKHLDPMVKNLYRATGLIDNTLYDKEKNWYYYYLKTQHWLKIRYDALELADFKCQLCGEQNKDLEVHHNTYDNLWNEKQSDVIVLCHPHHQMITNDLGQGEIYGSA